MAQNITCEPLSHKQDLIHSYLNFGLICCSTHYSGTPAASCTLCVLLSFLGQCHCLFTVMSLVLFLIWQVSEFNLWSHFMLPIPFFGYHVQCYLIWPRDFLTFRQGQLEYELELEHWPQHSACCSAHGNIVLFTMILLFLAIFFTPGPAAMSTMPSCWHDTIPVFRCSVLWGTSHHDS